MIQEGIISPVTEWCSGIVPVLKPNGKVHICVDLVQLNKSFKREVHPMYSVDESLANLSKSRVFSKLDANSRFWQLPLDKEPHLLTTFITPYSCYCLIIFPLGSPQFWKSSSTPWLVSWGTSRESYAISMTPSYTRQHKWSMMNDWELSLSGYRKTGVMLNEKCEFSKHSVKFLGHIFNEQGICPDPAKTEAICSFPVPQKVNDLQRFMGMVNQMAKFIPTWPISMNHCNNS